MPATKSLQDLFVHLLKDMYYAEKQILKTLPKMAKKADSTELRQAFEHHLKETEGQVERLERLMARRPVSAPASSQRTLHAPPGASGRPACRPSAA